jgi:hypothetical protein
MGKSVVMAIVAASLLLGCSDSTSSTPAEVSGSRTIQEEVSGSWALEETVVGNSFGMTLVADGSAISGTGAFQGRSVPQGSSVVTGSVTGSEVNLDFTLKMVFTDTIIQTAHFTGSPRSGKLVGTMQDGVESPSNPPVTAVFVRN